MEDDARVQQSIVVCFSIVGLPDEIAHAQANNTALPSLSAIVRACRPALHDEWVTDIGDSSGLLGRAVKTEKDFLDALESLARFQLEASKLGRFVIGGIALGDCLLDDGLVFGSAVAESHDITSTARFPRIVFAASARKFLDRLVNQARVDAMTRLDTLVLEDVDSIWFVNYLAASAGVTHGDVLAEHRAKVNTKLDEHLFNSAYYDKYSWLGSYHDYYCEQFEGLAGTYLVRPLSPHQAPSRLI